MTLDWPDWLRRWDAQQQVYVQLREHRYEVMLSLLEAAVPASADLLALDLAAGPGSGAVRLLERLPAARCVAVDADPVLLRLGESVHGDHGGRLRWLRGDLRDTAWADALVDAENLRLARPDATDAELVAAANAHPFISALPDGYGTSVRLVAAQRSGRLDR